MTKTLKARAEKMLRDENKQIVRDENGQIKIEYSFEPGSQVEVLFEGRFMILKQGDRAIKSFPFRYPYFFGGTTPSEKTLMKWESEGYCKTVTGYKTEPDGYGPDGSPSWMLALGLI